MAVGPPNTTTPQRPRRLRRRGGWLLYLAVITCPVGKLAIIALAGGAFGLTLDNPWIVGGVLLSLATGAVLLTRRVLHNRTSARDTDAVIAHRTAHDDLDG